MGFESMKTLLLTAVLLLGGAFPALAECPSDLPSQAVSREEIPKDMYVLMHVLQTITETYAVDHHGSYPASLAMLDQAVQGDGYGLNTSKASQRLFSSSISEPLILDAVTHYIAEPLGPRRYAIVRGMAGYTGKWLTPAELQQGLPVLSERGAVVYMPLYDEATTSYTGYRIAWMNAKGEYACVPLTKSPEQRALFYLSNA